MSGREAILSLDRQARVVQVAGDRPWWQVEAALHPEGLTLGALPSWLFDRTVAQSFAQDDRLRPSPRYGQLTDAALAIRAELPGGAVTRCSVSPRRATGPDLARTVLGTGGRAGRVLDCHLQVWRAPRDPFHRAHRYPSWRAAAEGGVAILRAGVRPVWWLLRADGKGVLLLSRLAGPSVARRYDDAAGGTEADPALAAHLGARCFPEPSSGRTTRLYAVRRADRERVGHAVRGVTDAQVWDLRPDGVTVYSPVSPPAVPPGDWAPLAERFYAALEEDA